MVSYLRVIFMTVFVNGIFKPLMDEIPIENLH